MEGNVENNYAIPNLKGKVVAVPLVDETLTKQGYAADAKKVGEELEKRVSTEDVQDNLTSESATKPLSARQGKALAEQLKQINLSQASTVGYDNTTSGLSSTNMQSAIDEVVANQKDNKADLDTLAETVDKFDEDYIPINGGGTITGAIAVKNADNGYGKLNKNHSADADYGTQVVDATKDGKTAQLSISAALDLMTFTDSEGNIRDIHHEGTKPFVEYTGNGSATARTIQTKGIGRLAVVYCSTNMALVTPKGAIVVTLGSGAFSWIDGAKASFLNGNLVLNTSNAAFNTSNETYYLQVI